MIFRIPDTIPGISPEQIQKIIPERRFQIAMTGCPDWQGPIDLNDPPEPDHHLAGDRGDMHRGGRVLSYRPSHRTS
jgi:hypothetical protein